MAWLDDRAWCHSKLVNLSDKAFRVYINSISYSSGMGLKGVLTLPQQKLMGANSQIRQKLIESGLWDDLGGSIEIHDWADHNSKRDERREKDRLRKREARRAERPQDSPQDAPVDSPHAEGSEGSEGSVEQSSTAQTLVAEYVEAARALGVDPPRRTVGHVARQVGELLNEGQPVGAVSAALALMVDKRLNPATLPSLLLEAVAGPARRQNERQVRHEPPVEEALDLPEISEEERLENLKRLKAMTA